MAELLRGWRTQTGALLLEGPGYQPGDAPYPLVTPTGALLAVTHDYYLVDALGAVTTIYGLSSGADSDYLYATAHLVEGTELCAYFCSYNTGATESPPWTTRSIVHAGLVALEPAAVPSAARLDAALRSYRLALQADARQSQQASQREEVMRRARFVSALPTPRAGQSVDLVFEYQPGTKQQTVVVRTKDGPVIFLENYRYHGKTLFRELEVIMAAHYRDRPHSLVAHLPDWDSGMAFNPD